MAKRYGIFKTKKEARAFEIKVKALMNDTSPTPVNGVPEFLRNKKTAMKYSAFLNNQIGWAGIVKKNVPTFLEDPKAAAMVVAFVEASVAPSLPVSVNEVTEGDSITNGVNATSAAKSYPSVSVAANPSGSTYTLKNIATAGIRASEINTAYATRGQTAYDATKALNVFTLMAGTNDSPVTTRIATYRNLRSILRKAKATGYQRRLIGTIPSRNDGVGTADTSFDGNTLALNLAIRAYWNSDLDCDGLFDFAADSKFDTALDANNTTYYSDYLHMTDAGYAAMGTIHEAAVAPILASPGVRVVPPANWSPYDYSSPLTLSNNNRTIGWAADGSGTAAARSFIGKDSGKWAWETTIDMQADIDFNQVGVCNQAFETEIWDGTKVLGNGTNAIGWANDTISYNGTAVVSGMPKLFTGDVIQHAVDLTANRYWVRKTGGLWNNSATANPVTGVGGIDISALGNGTRYPAVGLYKSGGVITSCFRASEMSAQISGFSALAA